MSKASEQKYPSYFPIGCPPEDASVEELEIYRFCLNDKPGDGDFVSYYLENPSKFAGNILAYGLSVLLSKEACLKAYRKYPYMRKYKSVAKGVTNKERGSWKKTPGRVSPGHVTWWVCQDVKPSLFFECELSLD